MSQLTRFDAASLAALNRALIGFDRIFNDFENRAQNNYPPHNVIKHDDNHFEIEIAVAGFNKDELSVEIDQDQLIIRGQKQTGLSEKAYLHRGLALRDFEKVALK